jgi:NhaP-type Na+/H+ or K+/H+ antiporter
MNMGIAHWSLLIGLLLILMMLIGTLLARMPMSSAMIYLVVGYVLGPGGLAVISPDPAQFAGELRLVSEIAVLIALFTVGLKMGVTPFDRRWMLPLRLAFVSMAATVGLIALVGVVGLGLPLGAAVLLGGILAPTDPVLASGVELKQTIDPDRVRFGLAGEGALNDGTAFPFVMLGLALMGLHELGEFGWRWWAIDLLWATFGGAAIGAALGALIGWLVVRLRTRHQSAVGLDEFLSLGLVGLAYGAAQLCLASGFLAVFAAGVALQRVREQPRKGTTSLDAALATTARGNNGDSRATHSHHASSTMSQGVQNFNEQLEKVAELAIVLIVGAMLPYAFPPIAAPPHALWWFIPLLFFLLRPLAVGVGTLGEPLLPGQRSMIGWFGIRGIGSVFYLMFAIQHGVSGALAEQLVTFTLLCVAVSILVHGVTAQPMMKDYLRRKETRSRKEPKRIE